MTSLASLRSSPLHPRVRALALLLVYLAGCAVVAALLAAGLGAVWQELFSWALPHVTPRALPG